MVTRTLKINKNDLPSGFRIVDVRECPTCSSPILFGLSDDGFNTICDGGSCCFDIIRTLVEKMQKIGFLSDDPTVLDVIQCSEEVSE